MDNKTGKYSVDFQIFDTNHLSQNMFRSNTNQEAIKFFDNLLKAKKSRKRKATTVVQPCNQTPLQLLNELIPAPIFKYSSDGPPHSPNFVASIEIKGKIYSGAANSKQIAKQKAAYDVISDLFPDKLQSVVAARDKEVKNVHIKKRDKKRKVDIVIKSAVTGETNPIMALNEIMPGIKYEYVATEGPQNLNAPFECKFQVGKESYHGFGSSKKSAKAAAARSYLLMFKTETEPELMDCTSLDSMLDPLFANKIYDLINSKYQAVACQVPVYAKRKVLAGIVMTKSADFSDAQVLNLSTGTKCISGEYLSCKGASLNDCHAEIISRRALVSFFYDQLKLHAKPETVNDSIFILKNNGKGYMLKPEIKFHLYVSTSCCGDARIFSPHEQKDPLDRHPNRQSRGQLRTKIESGEGTIPVKSSSNIQTWDGIMMGQKLLTMSCSDKVAKWNVVGVQGSLLTHFLDPIYLHSITLGSLFNALHTKRALYGRIENTLPPLPEPFKLNKILMSTVNSQEQRQAGKAPMNSLNWLSHDPVTEIVDASTGKTVLGNQSRLCKLELFTKFKDLLKYNLSQRNDLNQQYSNVYFNAKESSSDYIRVKHMFFQACVDANLGQWIKKPMEQDYFEIEL